MTSTTDGTGSDPGSGSTSGSGLDLALAAADRRVVELWQQANRVAVEGPGEMGLAAGDRPAADVEVMTSVLASVEYSVACFLHAASASGCLPIAGPGAMLTAVGWGGPWARRLARTGEFAAQHPQIRASWMAGRITSDHVDPIAKAARRFSAEELAALLEQLVPLWGTVSPAGVERFVAAAERMLHPPEDPTRDELEAYEARNLSFAATRDSVLISGELPRIEGEAVMAAIDALAERLRSTVEHTPATARRADALVELVNAAAAADLLPSRGGLPVALTVTLEHTALGDPVMATSRGHQLTQAETRWACCDAQVTPVLVDPTACAQRGDESSATGASGHLGVIDLRDRGTAHGGSPAARIAALAATLFDTRIPLAVGRTQRTATPAQRRALAARDRGCLIPGCPVPAEVCQAHHLLDWAEGGQTDIEGLALLCWTHHRQVDLEMWAIESGPLPGPSHGRSWPANRGAPFTITRTPRHSWRT